MADLEHLKKKGVYTVDLPREWLVKAAPYLQVLSSTLGLMLPVVAAGAKVALPEVDYKGIEAQLALGKASAEALLEGWREMGEKWLPKMTTSNLAQELRFAQKAQCCGNCTRG